MSDGKRINRIEAMQKAEEIRDFLLPVCERIEIAGSLRRGKPDVGDIELVCISRTIVFEDMFRVKQPPESLLLNSWLLDAAKMGKLIKGGDHYRQYQLDLCNLDLFITTPEQWGVIFMMRTGSADFSRRMVTPRSHGGFMPSNMHVKDGRIWASNINYPFETPEENNLFALYRMQFIKPENREKEWFI
jgi:DNA polymerase/3'-5' exonuclease PolX